MNVPLYDTLRDVFIPDVNKMELIEYLLLKAVPSGISKLQNKHNMLGSSNHFDELAIKRQYTTLLPSPCL